MLTSHSYKEDRKKAKLCYDASDGEDGPEVEKYLKVTLDWYNENWRYVHEMLDKIYYTKLYGIVNLDHTPYISFKEDSMFPEIRINHILDDDWHVCGIKNKKQGLEAIWFLNRYLFQYREYNLLQLSRTAYPVDILKLVKEFLF